jgi:hypothetical protein
VKGDAFEALPSSRDRAKAELHEQPGAIGEMMRLAVTIRTAAKEVARAVEEVAAEMDRERRGGLSVAARRDDSEILDTIGKVLGGAMVPEWCHGELVQAVGDLADELRKHVPPRSRADEVRAAGTPEQADSYRANRLDWARKRARDIARELGRHAPDPVAEPAPEPKAEPLPGIVRLNDPRRRPGRAKPRKAARSRRKG